MCLLSSCIKPAQLASESLPYLKMICLVYFVLGVPFANLRYPLSLCNSSIVQSLALESNEL